MLITPDRSFMGEFDAPILLWRPHLLHQWRDKNTDNTINNTWRSGVYTGMNEGVLSFVGERIAMYFGVILESSNR